MNQQGTNALPPPRWVVVLVTLVIAGTMVYVSTQGDYRTLIVLSVVLLFIFGADLAAFLRIWRGTPAATPPSSDHGGTP